MVTVSAPLVLKLFGEHAVVYGYRAIAAAVTLRVYVTVRPCDKFRIVSILGAEEFNEFPPRDTRYPYVTKAIEVFCTDVLGKRPEPVEIEIRSNVPPGCGLGTSAAVTVATIAALAHYFNTSITVGEVARLGHRVEQLVQGRASPMDTFTSSHGGLTLIYPRENTLRKLEYNISLPLAILVFRRRRSTKELVQHVARLREKFPDMVERIFQLIDYVCCEALDAIRRQDVDKLGTLMYLNHALLSALGVSNETIDFVVACARRLGVRGAKLSGAGDGGAVLLLTEHIPDEFRKAVEYVWRNELITLELVTIESHGIRRED